jgi:hypothetical protein
MEEAEELARTWEQGEVDGDKEGEGQPTHPPAAPLTAGRRRGGSEASPRARSLSSWTLQT